MHSKEDSTCSEMQEPVIKNLVDSKSPMENVSMVNKDKIKPDELMKYTSHFTYISTMSSFDDSYFKSTIRKDLLKDRHISWSAFKSLSKEGV